MICSACVYKSALKTFVETNGLQACCDFCNSEGVCVDDSELSRYMLDRANEALVTSSELSEYEYAMVFEFGSDSPAVFELWSFFEDKELFACDAFMDHFMGQIPDEKDEKGNAVLYAFNDGRLEELNDFNTKWRTFLTSIKCQNRFFSRAAKQFLDELFQVLAVGAELDPSVIVEINTDLPIYRARLASDKQTIKDIQDNPVSQLGPPPSHLTSNQRMSPAGIPVFYGALDRQTCISEIRPLVGDALVSGEFRACDQLRLLDLNKLAIFNADIDVFDDNYTQHSHAIAFYKELVFQMSRPARSKSNNPYLSTQVIFEYMSVTFDQQVDGVMYKSVQQDQSGDCIALFPQSSTISQTQALPENKADNPFSGQNNSKLYAVTSSLRFHSVRGVNYLQQEEDNDFILTASDRQLSILGERF